jgi:NAD-dependent dihydropyrimidine dehydrogenase PreA subunit
MWNITVDKEKCNGCGECVEGCSGEVYELVDGKAAPVNKDECHCCHTCEALCAAEAITVEDGITDRQQSLQSFLNVGSSVI